VIFLKRNKTISGLLVAATIMASAQAAYAMPSYGFGAAGNDSAAVHLAMNTAEISANGANAGEAPVYIDSGGANNQDVIYMDISVIGAVQDSAAQNGERIGTLTIPSGKQIGVFGGESMESMGKGGAHFSATGLNFGNTAIIGHNRGSAGYFGFLKELEEGQTVTLEAGGVTKNYTVTETHKIHETETDLLMQFGDSRLTLLTCWEGESDYRRVIIAYEGGTDSE
jgi:LPXTG-site transpeptidase (sortase) family protein